MVNIVEQLKKDVPKPKKRFGQTFLINKKIYRDIVDAADIKKGDVVLEIGAGTGTLTQYLLDAGAKVIAVEKDRDLIPILNKNVPGAKIVEGDILRINFNELHSGENYRIVSNIPYYLTSRLIKTIFETWPKPELVILMIQSEVAKRIIADPPEMNMLALSVQYYTEPKIIRKVPKGNFWPMPDVDSVIISLKPKTLDFDKEFSDTMFAIAKKAFAGKRKKLSTTLRLYLENLEDAGIDPNRRPETLTVKEWVKIAQSI